MDMVITRSAPLLGWRPAPNGAPVYNPATARRLGQVDQQPAVTTPAPLPEPAPAFIDSRPVQVVTDLAALAPSVMLTYAFWRAKATSWAVVFTAASALFGIKLIYDVTRLER